MAASREKYLSAAREMLDYINKSPSAFHAVSNVRDMLSAVGFTELKDTERWSLKPNQKYYVTKNESAIIAFAVGGKAQSGSGFSIIGAHTDSPCLKVKPSSTRTSCGFMQVGVECYGGGIWNTWFDRDLTVAGRVVIKKEGADGLGLETRLVNLEKPILRVPHLCIHLQRDMNDSFGPNKEKHILPVLATQVKAELMGDKAAPSQSTPGDPRQPGTQAAKHPPTLIRLLCQKLGVQPDNLLDFELCLADTQPAVIGGAAEEFLFAPRLDNLFNAWTAAKALIQSTEDSSLGVDTNIRMISLFDNEEVGSQSAQGAGSTYQESIMRRITCCLPGGLENPCGFEEACAKSYMISADQAHGVHPNYPEKHEENHKPLFHKGIVIKFNANQRYATTSLTAAILRRIAEKVNTPLQDVVVRNDSACGSTIGPIMSAKLGLQTIDVGAAQLSMHSIREMGGVDDVSLALDLYRGFFCHFPQVQAGLNLQC